jgi:hypothetical protein
MDLLKIKLSLMALAVFKSSISAAKGLSHLHEKPRSALCGFKFSKQETMTLFYEPLERVVKRLASA